MCHDDHPGPGIVLLVVRDGKGLSWADTLLLFDADSDADETPSSLLECFSDRDRYRYRCDRGCNKKRQSKKTNAGRCCRFDPGSFGTHPICNDGNDGCRCGRQQ
jgi:hypothetical protein